MFWSSSQGVRRNQLRNKGMSVKSRLLLRQWCDLKIGEGMLVRLFCNKKKGLVQQVVLPESLKQEVLNSIYNMCHSGIEHTVELTRDCFYCPRMYEDIKQFYVTCKRYGLGKLLATEHAPLKNIHTSEPLQLVYLDFLPLDNHSGIEHTVEVTQDHFYWPHLRTLHKTA